MYYSREQVKAMSQSEYEMTICKELNGAGFRTEFHGEKLEYQPEEFTFRVSIALDIKAVEYLKRIGLVDNGKCPMCSIREDELTYTIQKPESGAIFHVCKTCYKRYARQEQNKRGCRCCLGIILVIVLVVWGLAKLIN